MRTTILIFILFVSSMHPFAQDLDAQRTARPLNSVSVSCFGDAAYGAVNFDRQFLINPNLILSSKLGLGFIQYPIIRFSASEPFEYYLCTPHQLTINIGNGKHFFEAGLGGTIIYGDIIENYILYPIVGYRFLPEKAGKNNYRIYVQIPFSGLRTKDDLLFIPFGFSIGKSF